MKQLFHAVAVSAAVLATAPAFAEDVTETRQVTAAANVVRLGGAVSLHVKQGTTPSLVITGDKEMVERVTTRQDGATLVIDMDENKMRWGRNKGVRAELTLPTFKELDSDGVGSSSIKGFSGDTLTLSLDGAGSLTGDARYKHVTADIGGVGSVRLDVGNAETIDMTMGGTGSATLTGTASVLNARLGGVGSLEARALRAANVDLKMSGIGSATVHATESARLELSGLGGVTVYGNPPKRNSSATGLGSVKWK